LGVRSSGFSLVVGTGMIPIGAIVNVTSSVSHYRTIDQLHRGEAAVGHHSVTATVVALALALLGVGMSVYLVAVP
jgi:hypothetical protein